MNTKPTKPYRLAELKKKYAEEEMISIAELTNILQKITYGKAWVELQTKQARALIVLYYLTACRVSEIVKVKYLRKYQTITDTYTGNKKQIVKEKVKHEYLGVCKNDISFNEVDGKKVMYVRTENRKNKERKTKKQPIPIEKESSLCNFLIEYLNSLKEDQPLFKFGVKRATQIINDTLGFNVHFIRHIRATHLVVLYDFNEQHLIKFMGWTDARPAKHYMEINKKDLFRQFYKNDWRKQNV